MLRSDAHWPDLPGRYGKWKSVHTRFACWAKAGVWERVFKVLTADRKNPYRMLDPTLVRAHQQAATGKGGSQSGSGAFRGGLTTKIHRLADALGRPIRFILTGGHGHDIVAAPALLEGVEAGGGIADKAYDSNDFRQIVADAGMVAVIPSTTRAKSPSRTTLPSTKPATASSAASTSSSTFRRFATRFDRRAIHSLAFIHLAAAMIWMR